MTDQQQAEKASPLTVVTWRKTISTSRVATRYIASLNDVRAYPVYVRHDGGIVIEDPDSGHVVQADTHDQRIGKAVKAYVDSAPEFDHV